MRSTGRCSPTFPAPTGAGVGLLGAGRRAVRARRPLHRRSGSRRRRPGHRERGAVLSRTTAAIPGASTVPWTTPLVAVAHGWCMTLGIELLLAADIRIAAPGPGSPSSRCSAGSIRSAARRSACPGPPDGATRCAGCSPATSSTPPRRTGSGWSRRWPTTRAAALARARDIAHTIADRAAPLGVRATLALGPPGARPRGRGRHRAATSRPSPNSSPARTPPRACNRSSNVGRPASSGASRCLAPSVKLFTLALERSPNFTLGDRA